MAVSTPNNAPLGFGEFDATDPTISPLGCYYLSNLPPAGIEPDGIDPVGMSTLILRFM
jgi:hypothetical protein